jgi:eukaryotic-like serine/threonine-protein kinase
MSRSNTSSVKVLVESGPCLGKEYEFDEPGTLLVGRGSDCHIRLSGDSFVSRHHSMIIAVPPQISVRDLGSQNGTFVNDHPIPSSKDQDLSDSALAFPLRNNDVIRVGESAFRIILDPAHAADSQAVCSGCGALFLQPPGSMSNHEDPVCPVCKATSGFTGVLSAETKVDSGLDLELFGVDVPGFTVEERLGEGGLGIAYRAVDQRTNQEVAVKIVRKSLCESKKAQAMFLREMDVLRRLEHPNIVRLLHCGFTEQLIFFVMELCDGGDLVSLVKKYRGKMPVKVACAVFLQFLSGLAHAHDRGIVHRDLKPENTLLKNSDKKKIVKIADFGLAKQFQLAGFSGLTSTGQAGGSYMFMPREQLVDYKRAQPSSDVWSAAATFYYMLTARAPRTDKGQDPVVSILEGKVLPLTQFRTDVPVNVMNVVNRALSDDPEQRYSDAGKLREALMSAMKT